jgi:hypothetical protein
MVWARSPIGLRHITFQPRDVGSQACAHGRVRAPEAVFLRRQHLDELASSGEERSECVRLLIRQRAWRRTDDVGEVGEDLRIEGIGLGSFPRRLGNVPHLPRIGDHDRQRRRDERAKEWQLQATGRFQHDQGHRERPQALDGVGNPGLVMGHDKPSLGPQGHIQLGL